MIRYAAIATLVGCTGAGLGRVGDPFATPSDSQVGRPVMSFLWKRTVANHEHDHMPIEFARPAATPEVADAASGPGHRGAGRIFVGSHEGKFFALSSDDADPIWTADIGPTSARPLLAGRYVYVGSDDGTLWVLDESSGQVKWKYATQHGAILEEPVVVGDTVIVSTDADRVIALDRDTGKYRWQYDRETPEGFTIHGHAGVVAAGDRVVTGFSDGHLVALSANDGEVVWVRALAGEGNQAADVDTTPAVAGTTVIAASASGGLYGVDLGDGTDRWHVDLKGVSHLVLDGKRLYAAAPDTGLVALDLMGHVLWRQGFQHAGDPATPVVDGKYLFYATSDYGLYIIDKRNGGLFESFDTGTGVSSAPAIVGDRMFFMSNGGILYAMSIRRF